MVAKAHDLTDQQFGKLIALRPTGQRSSQKALLWECKCLACGQLTVKSSIKLKAGEVQTCGCGAKAQHARVPRGTVAITRKYHSYKNAAKGRGLPFELTRLEFKRIVTASCTYCGSAPAAWLGGSKGHQCEYGGAYLNGVDRVDNDAGYTLGNSVPCCMTCNQAKGTKTVVEFRAWIQRLIENFTA